MKTWGSERKQVEPGTHSLTASWKEYTKYWAIANDLRNVFHIRGLILQIDRDIDCRMSRVLNIDFRLIFKICILCIVSFKLEW